MHKHVVPLKNEIRVSLESTNVIDSVNGNFKKWYLAAKDSNQNTIASVSCFRVYPMAQSQDIIHSISSIYKDLTSCVITFDSSTLGDKDAA